jgi:hypothetical protein
MESGQVLVLYVVYLGVQQHAGRQPALERCSRPLPTVGTVAVMQVMVYTGINSLDARSHSGRAPMCLPTDHLLVEATLLVGEDQTEAEAARALGAFAERLLPLVTLKKLA